MAMGKPTLTKAQQEALHWLHEHGGDGSVQRGGVVLAQGEFAPHTAPTFQALWRIGFVNIEGKPKRITLTDRGSTFATLF